MLTIKECRTYLKNTQLTDNQIVQIRDATAVIIDTLLDSYLQLDESYDDNKTNKG